MIAVVYRMLGARRGSALTVFLLAVLAIAAAVAAPVYLLTAERSLVAAEVAAAPPRQTTLNVSQPVFFQPDESGRPAEPPEASVFDVTGPAVVATPGFRQYYARSVEILGAVEAPDLRDDPSMTLDAREGYCERVVLTSGRCTGGPDEIVIGDALAERLHLGLGDALTIQPIHTEPTRTGPPIRFPAGETKAMSIVGTYRPVDPASGYWGLVVLDRPLDPVQLPVLTDLTTIRALIHSEEFRSIVAIPEPGTITADRLGPLREDVTHTLRSGQGGLIASTSIVELLDRFDRERKLLRTVPTFAAVALVVLCWFVIFLAMAHTTEARRSELGLLKLRGVSGPDQAWLALAENVVAILAGGVVGYVVGHLAVLTVAEEALPVRVAVPITLAPLPYALITLLGAVAAGVVALRRDLVAPTLELMRRVPGRLGRWQGAVLGLVTAALAAGAVVQLRSEPADLSGLALLAPALVVLAGGLLLARVLDPLAAWSGRRALRRGRLGAALAALHFSRRGTGGRALALLVVAVALLGYAAIASETAERVRVDQAREALGADRVLSIGSTSPERLLEAVRAADPEGRYAMAAVTRPDAARGLLLAVDSPRLPAVAYWPSDSTLPLSGVPEKIHPKVGEEIMVTGRELILTATVPHLPKGVAVEVSVSLALPGGARSVTVAFPRLHSGRGEYRAAVPCPDGCRLGDLLIEAQPVFEEGGDPVVLTNVDFLMNGLRQAGPDRQLVDAAGFGRWNDRSVGGLRVTPDATGLAISIIAFGRSSALAPPDRPPSLPMITSGGKYSLSVPSVGGGDIAAVPAGSLPRLPSAGERGALVDLEYYARYVDNASAISTGQVWLARGAPAALVDRLREEGLVITADRRLSVELTAARQQPEAIGLAFFFAVAILGLILGVAGLALVAGVERRGRADELRHLLVQGLPRRAVRAASLRSYLLLAVPAALLGAILAELAWALTRAGIPTGEPVAKGFQLSVPGTGALLAWAGATAVLVLVATLLAARLARLAARSTR